MHAPDSPPQAGEYVQPGLGQEAETYERRFHNFIRLIGKFKTLDGNTEMLEIGPGTGWFPIRCAVEGLRCRGLEISPQMVRHARDAAFRAGVRIEIELGSIENSDLGREGNGTTW